MHSRNLIWLLLAGVAAALIWLSPWRFLQDADHTEALVSPSAPGEFNLEPSEKPSGDQEIGVPGPVDSADDTDAQQHAGVGLPALPAVQDSDPLLQERLADLSEKSQWRQWLSNDQLVRKAASVIAQLANGDIDRRAVNFLAPSGKFKAIERPNGGYVMDPDSYRRYNAVADLISSLDTKATVTAYLDLKPLFLAAMAELGLPGQDFDGLLLQAIDRLLAIRAPAGEVELIRPSVMYRFADSGLEGLLPAQKLLIRMGPRNIQAVQGTLRALRSELVRQLPG